METEPQPSAEPVETPAASPAAAPEPVSVGTSIDLYAIANHHQGHLFFENGWVVFYKNSLNLLVAAYSPDGRAFKQIATVSHIPIARTSSVLNIGGKLYIVYTDQNDMAVFLRTGELLEGKLQLDEPIAVVQRSVSFSAGYPSVGVGDDGRPWVVFRDGTDSNVIPLWMTAATDQSLSVWHEPVQISTPDQLRYLGFRSSALPVVVGNRLIVISSGDGHLFEAVSRNEFPPMFERSVLAGDFAGTHDYAPIRWGGKLHLAYVIDDGRRMLDELAQGLFVPDPPNRRMVYRRWTPVGGWSEPIDIGPTIEHSTALSVDGLGRVWVFYKPDPQHIWVRVSDQNGGAFGPARCLVHIPSDRNPPLSPSIAASYPTGEQVGLVWMEQSSRTTRFSSSRLYQYVVRFVALSLHEGEPPAGCPAAPPPASESTTD